MKLLVIEDNQADARLIEAILPGEAAVSWVDTLDAGVQKLTRESFDAVLLDLSLPDSDGLDSVATTHLFDSETPIVVLTGLDDQTAALEALRLGAHDYLVKGATEGPELLQRIQFAIARHKAQQTIEKARPEARDELPVRSVVLAPGDLDALAGHLTTVQQNHRILYLTVDQPASVLRERFARRDATDIHFIDASAGRSPSEEGDIHVLDETDLANMALEVELGCAGLGPDTHVVVDNINSLLLHQGVDEAAVFIHSLANRLRLLRLSADFIAHDNQEWPFIMDRLTFLDAPHSLTAKESPDPSFV